MEEKIIAEILKEVGALESGKEFYSLLGKIFPEEEETCLKVLKAIEEIEE